MIHEEFSNESEDEGYSQLARAAAASRCTWVSVIVNIVLSLTQIAVGLLSKSQGLVADGIHSLSDLIADFVVLFASHKSKQDADEGHPYGHLRFETAASMVLGLLLLIVGVGMIGSAVLKLETPRIHSDGACDCVVGCPGSVGGQGVVVSLYAERRQKS